MDMQYEILLKSFASSRIVRIEKFIHSRVLQLETLYPRDVCFEQENRMLFAS